MEQQIEDVARELELIATIFQTDPRNRATLRRGAAEILRLRDALATAREEGRRAGRLEGLEEAETAIAEKLELAISGPFWVGLNTALSVIRALKEKP